MSSPSSSPPSSSSAPEDAVDRRMRWALRAVEAVWRHPDARTYFNNLPLEIRKSNGNLLDLSSIRKKILQKGYDNPEEVASDISLLCKFAVRFVSPEAGQRLAKEFYRAWEENHLGNEFHLSKADGFFSFSPDDERGHVKSNHFQNETLPYTLDGDDDDDVDGDDDNSEDVKKTKLSSTSSKLSSHAKRKRGVRGKTRKEKDEELDEDDLDTKSYNSDDGIWDRHDRTSASKLRERVLTLKLKKGKEIRRFNVDGETEREAEECDYDQNNLIVSDDKSLRLKIFSRKKSSEENLWKNVYEKQRAKSREGEDEEEEKEIRGNEMGKENKSPSNFKSKRQKTANGHFYGRGVTSHQSSSFSSVSDDVSIENKHTAVVKDKSDHPSSQIKRKSLKEHENINTKFSIPKSTSFTNPILQNSAKGHNKFDFSSKTRPTDEQLETEMQMRKCMMILKKVMGMSQASPFLTPVDPIELGLPDYFQVIKHPMDLGTIEQRLKNRNYSSPVQVLADVELVWSNCKTYNEPKSTILKFLNVVEKSFYQLWNEHELPRKTNSSSDPSLTKSHKKKMPDSGKSDFRSLSPLIPASRLELKKKKREEIDAIPFPSPVNTKQQKELTANLNSNVKRFEIEKNETPSTNHQFHAPISPSISQEIRTNHPTSGNPSQIQPFMKRLDRQNSSLNISIKMTKGKNHVSESQKELKYKSEETYDREEGEIFEDETGTSMDDVENDGNSEEERESEDIEGNGDGDMGNQYEDGEIQEKEISRNGSLQSNKSLLKEDNTSQDEKVLKDEKKDFKEGAQKKEKGKQFGIVGHKANCTCVICVAKRKKDQRTKEYGREISKKELDRMRRERLKREKMKTANSIESPSPSSPSIQIPQGMSREPKASRVDYDDDYDECLNDNALESNSVVMVHEPPADFLADLCISNNPTPFLPHITHASITDRKIKPEVWNLGLSIFSNSEGHALLQKLRMGTNQSANYPSKICEHSKHHSMNFKNGLTSTPDERSKLDFKLFIQGCLGT